MIALFNCRSICDSQTIATAGRIKLAFWQIRRWSQIYVYNLHYSHSLSSNDSLTETTCTGTSRPAVSAPHSSALRRLHIASDSRPSPALDPLRARPIYTASRNTHCPLGISGTITNSCLPPLSLPCLLRLCMLCSPLSLNSFLSAGPRLGTGFLLTLPFLCTGSTPPAPVPVLGVPLPSSDMSNVGGEGRRPAAVSLARPDERSPARRENAWEMASGWKG